MATRCPQLGWAPRGGRFGRRLILGLAAAAALQLSPAAAQQVNPVYTDDSPVARETLHRVGDFIAGKNESEAIRELQKLLDELPDRLVPTDAEPELFVSVRSRVHATLLASPELLDMYRAAETARAAQELAAGNPEAVERSRLLTAPGLEAALRVAQVQMESAGFEAARITLEQLERHPTRLAGGQPARDAAAMLAQVARYLDRNDVRDRAARWAKEVASPAPETGAVELPASLRVPQTGFFKPAGPLDTEGVPSKPLWSTALEPQSVPAEELDIVLPDIQSEEDYASNLWVLPTVAGDTVYVNDGMFITARDRFTLQPRWSVQPSSEDGADDQWAPRRAAHQAMTARNIEDTSTVTISGRILVATTGIAQHGVREGDSPTSAIDIATGKVLWSVLIDRLDPQLDSASVRGPALIDGGTVVLCARKSSQGRRIVSVYLVGLSLDSGKLSWIRPIASAGSLPFGQREPRVSQAPLLHQGIVYCVDQLGAMGAVEAATGRPVWIRSWPVPAIGMGGPVMIANPWQWGLPIPRGDSVVLMTPERAEVLRIDRASGVIQARRSAAALGSPAYILGVGDRLAAVGNQAVYFTPIDSFDSGPVVKTRTFGYPIRGRVVVSGDRLLIPRSDGVAVIDPADPTQDAAALRLDRLGNVLPLESQLLIVDATSLHSYLTWTVAQRLLQERMDRDAADADPAITYADLAYRSGHPDAIVGAADRALNAIDKAPTTPASRAARTRLFGVLRDMVEYSQAKWLAPAAAAAAPPPVRDNRPGRRPLAADREPNPDLPVLDPVRMAPIIERLGRSTQTSDERVSYLMALGRLLDAQARFALAAESYQRILDDQALAGAAWRSGGVSVRAELEATRRLRQLVLDRGPTTYAAFEAQAGHELEMMGPAASAADLERLARRYPASALAATVWIRAADLHQATGRSHAAVSALREGLVAAETARASGSATDPAVLGEVAGRLVRQLQGLEQLFAAAQLLSRLNTQFPGMSLTARGERIDPAALGAELLTRLAALQRLPRIGPEIRPDVQALAGWQILTPRSREGVGRAAEHVMMVSPSESRVALWGIAGAPQGGAGKSGPTHVQLLWSREFKGLPPILLRLDPESVYLFWERTDGGDGAVIERIGAVGGETRWRTAPFRDLFAADPDLERRMRLLGNRITTPIQERDAQVVMLSDVLVAIDEQVLAVVERSGRAAGFDPESGRLLWHTTTPVSQVNDIDVGAGAVVIGGAAAPAESRAAIVGLSPMIAVYDARTGQPMHNMDKLSGEVRWLCLTGQADQRASIIAGLGPEVASFDLVRGKTNWTIPGGPGLASLGGWVFGDLLYLLDSRRTLYSAPLATGRLGARPLDTYEQLTGSSPIEATPIGPGLKFVAFTSDRGVCIINDRGEVVGLDSLEAGGEDDGVLVRPVASERYFVAVETKQIETPGGQILYNLHILDTRSAMLKSTRQLALEMTPTTVAILDGRILVTAGAHTIVYSAPETDR